MSQQGNSNLKSRDMTVGNPVRLILAFAIPIFIGNIFQQFYSVIDTMIAGHKLGDDALAAIGATGSIYNLVVGMANGMNNGYAIIISRSFGAKDERKMKNAIAITMVLNVLVAVLFTILSCIFIMPLLELLHTPKNVIMDAYQYIIIILLGMIITVAYNMEAGILRAVGNSRTPLYFLIISSIANIILDLVFVVVLSLGIQGLALATVIAQAISAILCFCYIKKYYKELKIQKEDFRFNKNLVTETFMTGLSMGLMNCIYTIGSVMLQGAINTFGKATITAHHAARKLDSMLMLPLSTLAAANATFVSQNYGANQLDRIKVGIKKTCVIGFIWSTFSVFVSFICGPILIQWLTNSEDTYVIKTAALYLNTNTPFFYSLGILFVLRTSLQGMGRKIAPIVSSSIELIGKAIAATFIVPKIAYIGVCFTEPVVWVLCTIFLFFSFMHVYKTLNEN